MFSSWRIRPPDLKNCSWSAAPDPGTSRQRYASANVQPNATDLLEPLALGCTFAEGRERKGMRSLTGGPQFIGAEARASSTHHIV